MYFRKKPVVVQARRFTLADAEAVTSYGRGGAAETPIEAWCHGSIKGVALPAADRELEINTLEGDMRARVGDWVICGTKGEFYPCKPDIFAENYEPVSQ